MALPRLDNMPIYIGNRPPVPMKKIGIEKKRLYRLVWATKVALAAICFVFPALVLGYKSFNVSMYHVPVPT